MNAMMQLWLAAFYICHVAALLAIIVNGKETLSRSAECLNACYVNRNGQWQLKLTQDNLKEKLQVCHHLLILIPLQTHDFIPSMEHKRRNITKHDNGHDKNTIKVDFTSHVIYS